MIPNLELIGKILIPKSTMQVLNCPIVTSYDQHDFSEKMIETINLILNP